MNNLVFHSYDFLEKDEVYRRADKLNLDVGCDSDITVIVKAVKVSNEKIYVSGTIEGFLTLECSRCLFLYRFPISINMDLEMNFINGIVDAGEEARQLIILDMPMKPLCSDECLGICPVCGKRNKKNDSCICVDRSHKFQEDIVKERWKNLFENNRRK
ncbi:MAG: hypothetical protein LBV66_01055 [Elusimicrobiota bacterium]|jgi:uncharacterized protein|nr:hypothetical protein [Elusimicrobiota bacterium]